MTLNDRVTIFSLENLDIKSPLHIVIAICFDYLIIPCLIPGYEYYPKIIFNKERIKLQCLTRISNKYTRQISQKIQLLENPINKYFFTLSWCWFIRSPKYYYTYDSHNWDTYKIKFDPNYRRVIKIRLKLYYLDSIKKYRDCLTDKLLNKYKLDNELVKSSFQIGFLKDHFDMSTTLSKISKNSRKSSQKKSIQIFSFKRFKYRFNLKYNNNVNKKIILLQKLIHSRKICEAPLCNKLCFLPNKTCINHRYLETIFKNRIVRPSTKQLLDLEKSIKII